MLGKQEHMKRMVREAEDSVQWLENDLGLMTNERNDTAQEKKNLEVSQTAFE